MIQASVFLKRGVLVQGLCGWASSGYVNVVIFWFFFFRHRGKKHEYRINDHDRIKAIEDKRKIRERGMKSKTGKYRLLRRHREMNRGMKVFIYPVGEERRARETSKVSCWLKKIEGVLSITLGFWSTQARAFNCVEQHTDHEALHNKISNAIGEHHIFYSTKIIRYLLKDALL